MLPVLNQEIHISIKFDARVSKNILLSPSDCILWMDYFVKKATKWWLEAILKISPSLALLKDIIYTLIQLYSASQLRICFFLGENNFDIDFRRFYGVILQAIGKICVHVVEQVLSLPCHVKPNR